jgi:hypothetical protein
VRVHRGIVTLRVRIRDRVWRVRFMPARHMGNDWGRCYHPSRRNPLIEVRRSLRGRNLIDTIIHELLHAQHPEMTEEAVDTTACMVARALYAAGCRISLPQPKKGRRA